METSKGRICDPSQKFRFQLPSVPFLPRWNIPVSQSKGDPLQMARKPHFPTNWLFGSLSDHPNKNKSQPEIGWFPRPPQKKKKKTRTPHQIPGDLSIADRNLRAMIQACRQAHHVQRDPCTRQKNRPKRTPSKWRRACLSKLEKPQTPSPYFVGFRMFEKGYP